MIWYDMYVCMYISIHVHVCVCVKMWYSHDIPAIPPSLVEIPITRGYEILKTTSQAPQPLALMHARDCWLRYPFDPGSGTWRQGSCSNSLIDRCLLVVSSAGPKLNAWFLVSHLGVARRSSNLRARTNVLERLSLSHPPMGKSRSNALNFAV